MHLKSVHSRFISFHSHFLAVSDDYDNDISKDSDATAVDDDEVDANDDNDDCETDVRQGVFCVTCAAARTSRLWARSVSRFRL